MTSNFTTPFRPRVKSRAVKVPRDLLPLDPTNTSIGISEREIKTEDDEVVYSGDVESKIQLVVP